MKLKIKGLEMTRLHVISISVLIGFVSGLTLMGAKAFSPDTQTATASYQCVNGYKAFTYEKGNQPVINLDGNTFIYSGTPIHGIDQYQGIGRGSNLITIRDLGSGAKRITGSIEGQTLDTVCE
ncbi:hypothetical protein KXY27_004553 [Salmonella enterica]|nr:hypothetical protein [Salmonella enterica]EHU5767751.1 hypothetical protein [Salmonella enterica]